MSKTDKEIVSGVLLDKEQAIHRFFFEECKPIFLFIIRKIFNHKVEENELINELYLYLKEKNWQKLRQFDYRYKLKTWISKIAFRFFEKKKMELMQKESSEHLLPEQIADESAYFKDDAENLLNVLQNKRYRSVILALILEDREPKKVADEMGVTVENLHKIKRRALQQIKKIIEKEFAKL